MIKPADIASCTDYLSMTFGKAEREWGIYALCKVLAANDLGWDSWADFDEWKTELAGMQLGESVEQVILTSITFCIAYDNEEVRFEAAYLPKMLDKLEAYLENPKG